MYETLLRMGRTYLDLLRPLGALDFVDVQSFIFVSCGGYDNDRPTSKRMPEVVLKVGSEGGAIKLLWERNAGENYQFWTESDETALSGVLDEDDLIGAGGLSSQSQRVNSLDEAFILLGRYPWYSLHPIEVHPDLLAEVLREVKRRGRRRRGETLENHAAEPLTSSEFRILSHPSEVIKGQVSLPIKSVGYQSSAISGTVVNADSPVGLELGRAREPVMPKESRLHDGFKPRMFRDRQIRQCRPFRGGQYRRRTVGSAFFVPPAHAYPVPPDAVLVAKVPTGG
jgi:hypothetical protein